MNRFIIISIWFFISCQFQDNIEVVSETVERFSVSYKGDSLVIGQMNFKEKKYLDSKQRTVRKELFDKLGNVKGTEKITLANGESESSYFDINNNILSKYNYKYSHDILIEKNGYDANGNLLRIEQYDYDGSGNLTEKIILDSEKRINRIFKFAYDTYGNELGFSAFNEKGEIIILETYKITELNDQNQWIKKWSTRDSVVVNYYERTFEKINK